MCMGILVLCVCSLPERIRPTVLAFGGVADGFVPFDAHTSNNNSSSSSKHDVSEGQVELELASIVMKAVQVGPGGLPGGGSQGAALSRSKPWDALKCNTSPCKLVCASSDR